LKYRIIIKRCENEERARTIAEEIARWSGNSFDIVFTAITSKAVCIKREADQDEAMKLKDRFEAIGAEVELTPIGSEAKAAAAPRAQQDDDDDVPGRILTDAEMVQIFNQRPDIWYIQDDKRMNYLEVGCLMVGLAFGLWLSTYRFEEIKQDFLEKMPEERAATLQAALPENIQKQLDRKSVV
jgi:hypothetical protein